MGSLSSYTEKDIYIDRGGEERKRGETRAHTEGREAESTRRQEAEGGAGVAEGRKGGSDDGEGQGGGRCPTRRVKRGDGAGGGGSGAAALRRPSREKEKNGRERLRVRRTRRTKKTQKGVWDDKQQTERRPTPMSWESEGEGGGGVVVEEWGEG